MTRNEAYLYRSKARQMAGDLGCTLHDILAADPKVADPRTRKDLDACSELIATASALYHRIDAALKGPTRTTP